MNEMVIIIRPSFKKICGPDACRAAVFNHILYRLARKAKDEPEEKVKKGEVFWFASAEDICKDMDNAWCVNKIRKEIKVLFESGLLGQRHNPLKKWDRKFQYFISDEQGATLLEKCKETGVCLMHIGLNSEVLHLLFMVNAFDKYGGCNCQEKEMDAPNMVDANTKYGRAIPKGSTKGSSEESNQEESTNASAIASATSMPFEQEEIPTVTPKASVPFIEVTRVIENNSYSESKPTQQPPTKPPRKQPSKPKNTLDDVTQKRVDDFYSYLDELKQEVMGDATSAYQRTQKGTEAIIAILPLVPTQRKVKKVFLDMWNEKGKDGQYFWRRHMKPHNICSEYESRIMALEGKTLPSADAPVRNIVRADERMREQYRLDRERAAQRRKAN